MFNLFDSFVHPINAVPTPTTAIRISDVIVIIVDIGLFITH